MRTCVRPLTLPHLLFPGKGMSHPGMCEAGYGALSRAGPGTKGRQGRRSIFFSVAVVAERDSSYGGLIARARSLRPHLDSPLLSSRPPCLHRSFPGNLSLKNLFNFLYSAHFTSKNALVNVQRAEEVCVLLRG